MFGVMRHHIQTERTNASFQGDKVFSIQPIKETVDAKLAPFKAQPGPAIPKDFAHVQQEGTKEERRAKAEELNKK